MHYGDVALPSICPASCCQLVNMFITLEPYGIYYSKFNKGQKDHGKSPIHSAQTLKACTSESV